MDRRKLLKLLSLVPFAGLLPRITIAADAKPANAVGEKEPLAIAMKYVEDASKATAARTDKNAFCYNCDRWNKCNDTDKDCKPGKDANAPYNPCNLFPGKVVANKGWCVGWQPKA